MNTYDKEQLQQHGEVILAYINGASIEYTHPENPEAWFNIDYPTFSSGFIYRVAKPKRKMKLIHFIDKSNTCEQEQFFVREDKADGDVEDFIRHNNVSEPDYTSTCEIIHTFELEPLE